MKAVTGAYNLGTSATSNILAIGGTTAFTTATLSDALEVGGSHVLTYTTAIAANEGYVVFYDDNVDTYGALVVAGSGIAAGATGASGDYTIHNLVKFSGVSDATTITSSEVLAFIA